MLDASPPAAIRRYLWCNDEAAALRKQITRLEVEIDRQCSAMVAIEDEFDRLHDALESKPFVIGVGSRAVRLTPSLGGGVDVEVLYAWPLEDFGSRERMNILAKWPEQEGAAA